MRRENVELFSEKVVAGKRTYFFDLKESTYGVYVAIRESKQVGEGDYEHHRIIVSQEYIPTFIEGLRKVLEVMKKFKKKDG